MFTYCYRIFCYSKHVVHKVSFIVDVVTLICKFCTFIALLVCKSVLSEIAEAGSRIIDLSFHTSVHYSTRNMSEVPAEKSPSPKCIIEKCPTPPRSIPSPEATETGIVPFLIELSNCRFRAETIL